MLSLCGKIKKHIVFHHNFDHDLLAMKFKPVRPIKQPGRVGKKKQQRDPAKWLHHSLKTVHKALKQARSFEVRKITRRLAQARTDEAGSAGPVTALVTKLEQQLLAAKQADLETLTQQAAASAGLIIAGQHSHNSAPAVAATAVTTAAPTSKPDVVDAKLAAAVHQRLMSASCVVKQLQQQTTEFKRKFGGSSSSSITEASQRQQEPLEGSAPAAQAATHPEAPKERSSKRQKVEQQALNVDSQAVQSGSQHTSAGQQQRGDGDHMHNPKEPHHNSSGSDRESSGAGTDSASRSLGDEASDTMSEGGSGALSGGGSSSSSTDLEAEYEAQQAAEQGQDEGPPADDELDGATLAALQSLRGKRARTHQSDSEDGSDIVMTAAGEVVSCSDDEDLQEAAAVHSARHKQQRPGAGHPAAAAASPSQPTHGASQLSRLERLQQKKRAKLEKLLKRGKRVGQRMRKKLYEKLYGLEAHHLKAHQGGPSRKQQQRNGAGAWAASNSLDKAAIKQGEGTGQQRRGQKQQQPQQSNPTKQQPTDSDLHPSWAARRAQKPSTVSAVASGSKVVFGDDGEAVPVKRSVQASQQQQQQQKNSNLQPASRRQQTSGTSTAGARREGPKLAAKQDPKRAAQQQQQEQLHPSWQAKKQMQAAIVLQPAGKKVVFDD